MAKTNDTRTNDLKVEMMLQINQKLWESGVISKEVYEAVSELVPGTRKTISFRVLLFVEPNIEADCVARG